MGKDLVIANPVVMAGKSPLSVRVVKFFYVLSNLIRRGERGEVEIEKGELRVSVEEKAFEKFIKTKKEPRRVARLLSSPEKALRITLDYEVALKWLENQTFQENEELRTLADEVRKEMEKAYRQGFKYAIFNPIRLIEIGKGKIRFTFDRLFVPFILKFTKDYTKLPSRYFTALRGNYSIRLYEILKKHQNLGKFSIEWKDYLVLLGVVKPSPNGSVLIPPHYLSHEVYTYIHRFVKKPLKEINSKTDINVSFSHRKKGDERILTFSITPKNAKKLVVEELVNYLSSLQEKVEIELQGIKKTYPITADGLVRLLKNFSRLSPCLVVLYLYYRYIVKDDVKRVEEIVLPLYEKIERNRAVENPDGLFRSQAINKLSGHINPVIFEELTAPDCSLAVDKGESGEIKEDLEEFLESLF